MEESRSLLQDSNESNRKMAEELSFVMSQSQQWETMATEAKQQQVCSVCEQNNEQVWSFRHLEFIISYARENGIKCSINLLDYDWEASHLGGCPHVLKIKGGSYWTRLHLPSLCRCSELCPPSFLRISRDAEAGSLGLPIWSTSAMVGKGFEISVGVQSLLSQLLGLGVLVWV